MKITTYDKNKLQQGQCVCCDEISDEIIPWNGLCVDCYELEEFIEMSQKILKETDGEHMMDEMSYKDMKRS